MLLFVRFIKILNKKKEKNANPKIPKAMNNVDFSEKIMPITNKMKKISAPIRCCIMLLIFNIHYSLLRYRQSINNRLVSANLSQYANLY